MLQTTGETKLMPEGFFGAMDIVPVTDLPRWADWTGGNGDRGKDKDKDKKPKKKPAKKKAPKKDKGKGKKKK